MTVSLAAEPLAHIGTFPVTNALVISVFVFLFLAISAILIRKHITSGVPKGVGNLLEAVIEGLVNTIDSITQDPKKTRTFFPIVMTIFLYILFANWTELIPGLGSIGIYKEVHGQIELVPFLRSPSADLNFTIAMALISVIAAQWYGMRMLGFFQYWEKFFVAPWKPPYLIGTFVGLLEFVSEFAKVISFSFRLFGNIFAGEILLIVVGTLAPTGGTLPFLFLEIFVGLVQALVFALLTTVFLTIATTGHGDETHASDEDEDALKHKKAISEHMATQHS